MNLQPVYPGRPLFSFVCSGCGNERERSDTAFADLDAPAGTYLCVRCVQVGNHMTHNQIVTALDDRDRRELASYRQLGHN